MRRFAAFLLILFCLGATSAALQPELSRKFVGSWRLISIEGHPPGRTNVFDRPTGLLMYDPSGRMSVQIVVKADRKPFAPLTKGLLTATTEEKAAAFESYAAYFGTFTIDAHPAPLTHHLQPHLLPPPQATANVRCFALQPA